MYVISTEAKKSLQSELSDRTNSPSKIKNITWTPEAPVCPPYHCPSPKVTTSLTPTTIDEFCLILNLMSVQSCTMTFCHVAEGIDRLFILIDKYSILWLYHYLFTLLLRDIWILFLCFKIVLAFHFLSPCKNTCFMCTRPTSILFTAVLLVPGT